MLDERKFFVKKVCQSDTSPLEKVCQPPKKCVRNGHLRKKKTLTTSVQQRGQIRDEDHFSRAMVKRRISIFDILRKIGSKF